MIDVVLQVCGGDKPYMSPDMLMQEHQRCKEGSSKQFTSTRKMGGLEFSQAYSEQLDEEMQQLYENFMKHNESKNVFAAARTPAVLFVVMSACYILAGIFTIFGMDPIAGLLNLVMVVALVMLSTWAYVRYSGDYREVGVNIDKLADFIWEHVSAKTYDNNFCLYGQ